MKNNSKIVLVSVMMLVPIVLLTVILKPSPDDPKIKDIQIMKVQKDRDNYRISQLRTIHNALEIYQDDYNHYPISTGECLNEKNLDENNQPTEASTMANFLKGTVFPTDPIKTQNSALCTGAKNLQAGRYFYKSLSDGNEYLLCANVENFEKANTVLGNKDTGLLSKETSEQVDEYLNDVNNKATANTKDNQKLYCVVNN